MTPRQTTFSIPEGGAATLTLPEALTLESMSRLENEFDRMFRMLRSDLRGPATDDPGAVEFDSWIAQLH
jgi:hypothetical protein